MSVAIAEEKEKSVVVTKERFASKWLQDLFERFKRWCSRYAEGSFKVVEASAEGFVVQCITSREIAIDKKKNRIRLKVEAKERLSEALERAEEEGIEGGWIYAFARWLREEYGYVPLPLDSIDRITVRSNRLYTTIEGFNLHRYADVSLYEIGVRERSKTITLSAKEVGRKSITLDISWL